MGERAETSSAWSQWLRRHGPAMLLLARQVVPNRADAEDVVQEACLRAFRFFDNQHGPNPKGA